MGRMRRDATHIWKLYPGGVCALHVHVVQQAWGTGEHRALKFKKLKNFWVLLLQRGDRPGGDHMRSTHIQKCVKLKNIPSLLFHFYFD